MVGLSFGSDISQLNLFLSLCQMEKKMDLLSFCIIVNSWLPPRGDFFTSELDTNIGFTQRKW